MWIKMSLILQGLSAALSVRMRKLDKTQIVKMYRIYIHQRFELNFHIYIYIYKRNMYLKIQKKNKCLSTILNVAETLPESLNFHFRF